MSSARTQTNGSVPYQFQLELGVRDYECDLQGIVNNAVYQNYLEHARHEYLKSVGLDFAELHRQEINAVVTRIEIDYRHPLASGNRFVVRLGVEQRGRFRVIFHQDIYRLPDQEHVVQAIVFGALLHDGKPVPLPPEMRDAIRH